MVPGKRIFIRIKKFGVGSFHDWWFVAVVEILWSSDFLDTSDDYVSKVRYSKVRKYPLFEILLAYTSIWSQV